MKLFVAGGAGYIGSHVVLELLSAGHDITVFDNLSSGSRDNLFPSVNFIYGDLHDRVELTRALSSGFDAVVHLAAYKAAGESMLDPAKYSYNNISGTINLLESMLDTGVRMLVFSSSAAVYGEPVRLPIDEEHPLEPENYYGFTKLEIERILRWYDSLKGLRFAALRYFNAAGYDAAGRVSGLERNPANLLPVIMEVASGMRKELQIFGNDYDTPDGTGVRDYVHVSDLARGHLAALNWMKQNDASLTVNLGSEKGFSVMELLETARKISGKAIPAKICPRRPGDPASLYASSAKARELLGWEAKESDAESLIRSTWNAYCKNVK